MIGSGRFNNFKLRLLGLPILLITVSGLLVIFSYFALKYIPVLNDKLEYDFDYSSSRRSFPSWYTDPKENEDAYFKCEDDNDDNCSDDTNRECRFLCYNRLRESFLDNEESFLIDMNYLYNFTNFDDFHVWIAKRGQLKFIYLCEGEPEVRCVLRKDCGIFSCEYKQMCELCTSCFLAKACYYYCTDPSSYKKTLKIFENEHGTENWITNYFLASFRQRCWRMDHFVKKYCRYDKKYYTWMDPDLGHVLTEGTIQVINNEDSDFIKKCSG